MAFTGTPFYFIKVKITNFNAISCKVILVEIWKIIYGNNLEQICPF